jgi:hypothetical protein
MYVYNVCIVVCMYVRTYVYNVCMYHLFIYVMYYVCIRTCTYACMHACIDYELKFPHKLSTVLNSFVLWTFSMGFSVTKLRITQSMVDRLSYINNCVYPSHNWDRAGLRYDVVPFRTDVTSGSRLFVSALQMAESLLLEDLFSNN